MAKKSKSSKNSKFSIALIIVDVIVLICFFLAYGPFSFFRDYLVTTAMTTMNHKYFAYVLYSEEMVEKILANNKIIESDSPTDISKINTKPVLDTGTYESIYEEQVLKRDKNNDIYKLVNISGSKWKGYMVVVYEPSLDENTTFFGSRIVNDLETFTDMCDVIIANRYEACLDDVRDKVYTRDIFQCD